MTGLSSLVPFTMLFFEQYLSLSLSHIHCSRSIRIGTVVVVHWVGCVCNQFWHVHTCLSNSWHQLQVAAFAQLAVVGHGSNTCIYVIAIFTMCESTKQRIFLFCFKIRKTTTETYQLSQQAFGEDVLGRTQVFDWFCQFKEGRSSAESDLRLGRPSTSRNEEMIAKVRTIVRNNRKDRLKKVLKGHQFEATEDIKWNSTKTLLDILKEELAKCFQQWQRRWAKCVAAEGNYVEDNYS